MKYELKVVLIHIAICVIISLLSLIGLFFNNWELSTCVSISSIFGILYFLLLLKSGNMVNPKFDGAKTGTFLLFTFLRFGLALIGLLIPALIIHFSNPDGDKIRYLNILGSTLPFISVNIILVCCKRRGD